MTTQAFEQGDLYFFYRPKIDVSSVENASDVQRLYMVMLPDEKKKGRLLLVGRKQMPDIIEGKSKSTEREWAMVMVHDEPNAIREDLSPVAYGTETRGERREARAVPVGEGRYALYERNDSTRLGYRLERPKKLGQAQDELGIRNEATYVVSVRNPSLDVRGFPKEKPDYPKSLEKNFADRRWLDVSDPKLLDYENAQLVLIGAHESLDHAAVDITGRSELEKKLGPGWQTDALKHGVFPEPSDDGSARAPYGDRSKGGRRGGQAASETASAAGIAQALKGIGFPRKRAGLLSYAEAHDAQDEIVAVLEQLPNRKFENMADVQKALGEVR